MLKACLAGVVRDEVGCKVASGIRESELDYMRGRHILKTYEQKERREKYIFSKVKLLLIYRIRWSKPCHQ